MYVHLYSRGEDLFKEKLSVHEACQLVELQSTIEEEQDNFIGFTHPSSDDAIIQFIRMNKNEWILDIPMYNNGEYTGSLVTKIDHSHTLMIVTEFYHKTEFQAAIISGKYKILQEIVIKKWKISFNTIRD